MARYKVELSFVVKNPVTDNVVKSDSVVYEADQDVLARLPMGQAVQEMVNVLLADAASVP